MGAMESLSRRAAATHRRLLEAAAEELIETGDVEVAAVARRAGLSVGLPYRYFGTRSGLMSALLADFYDRLVADTVLASFDGRTWLERWRTQVVTWVDRVYADPLAPVVLGRMVGDAEVAAMEARCVRQIIATGVTHITAGQAEGAVAADRDPELLAAGVVGGMRPSSPSFWTRPPDRTATRSSPRSGSSPSPRWEPTTPRCARSTCHDAKSHVAPAQRRLRGASHAPARRHAAGASGRSSPRCSAPPGATLPSPRHTRQVFGVLHNTRAVDELVDGPDVLALLDRLLLPNFLLSQLEVVEVRPRRRRPAPAPRRRALSLVPPPPGPVGGGPVDDRRGQRPHRVAGKPPLARQPPPTGPGHTLTPPVGSCTVLLGTLWHARPGDPAPRREPEPDRRTTTASRGYAPARPSSPGRDVTRQLSRRVRRMLGYGIPTHRTRAWWTACTPNASSPDRWSACLYLPATATPDHCQ